MKARGHIIQMDGMDAGGEPGSNHGPAHRDDLGVGAVHLQLPAVVIGDGEVDEALLFHLDGALDLGIRDASGHHGGGGELLQPLVKDVGAENCRLQNRHSCHEAGAGGPVIEVDFVPLPELTHTAVVAVLVAVIIQALAVDGHQDIRAVQAAAVDAQHAVLGHGEGDADAVLEAVGLLCGEVEAGGTHSVQLDAAEGIHRIGVKLGKQRGLDAAHLPEEGIEPVIGLVGVAVALFVHRAVFQGVLVHHEAQGEIGLIFEKQDLSVGGHFLKIGGICVSALPVNDVLDAEQQIGEGVGLLVGVAVARHGGGQTDALQELGGAAVDGGGEGGNAPVIQQSAVVEGVFLGHLRPPEVGIVLL